MKYTITMFIFALAFSANAQVSTQPVQPPWYYYWPTENADNFQYSELGNSSLSSGSGLQRRSNIDVNKQEVQGESSNYVSNQPDTIDVDLSEPTVNVSSRPTNSSPLIKWVDDKGVVHVTNNPNSIPDKYKDQIKN